MSGYGQRRAERHRPPRASQPPRDARRVDRRGERSRYEDLQAAPFDDGEDEVDDGDWVPLERFVPFGRDGRGWKPWTEVLAERYWFGRR